MQLRLDTLKHEGLKYMITKRKLGLTLTAGALMLLHGQAHSEILNPVADSTVDKGSPAGNLGAADHLRVKNANSNFVRKSYVRYDLSGLSFDHTTGLDAATLTMAFYDGNVGLNGTTVDWTFEVYGLNDGDAGEAWGENTITWNNAPQNNTANGNGVLAGATSLGTFNFVGRTQVVNFNGNGGDAVRDFVAASSSDDLVTFIIVRNTAESGGDTYIHYLGSKENAQEANVTLTLTEVPEPGSLALLTLGGLLVARRRR